MRKILKLPVIMPPEEVEFDHDLSLEEMQKLVDGDIELFPYRVIWSGVPVQMLVNEDGRNDGSPFNTSASTLAGGSVFGPAFCALDKDLE